MSRMPGQRLRAFDATGAATCGPRSLSPSAATASASRLRRACSSAGGGPLAPELLQQDCTPDKLASALAAILAAPGSQQAGFNRALALLRAPEGLPSEAAATAVLRALDAAQGVENLALLGNPA